MKKGYIQVYTGNGKGKTTAAIGLAVRAAGAGLRICFCQFLKGRESSELKILKKLNKNVTVLRSGEKSFVYSCKTGDRLKARNCFKKVSAIILQGKCDVVILDEINAAIALNLINIKELVRILKGRPPHVEIVLTGRDAPKEIIKIADLVTSMTPVKHYYSKGIPARKGIEL
jgi:cob(I)alamin adenosyltransferase